MSSLAIRGSDQQIRISVGGVLQPGSFANVLNFKESPKWESKMEQYLGERRDKENLQLRGYNISFGLNEQDAACQSLLESLRAAYDNGQPFPDVTVTLITNYIDGVTPPSAVAYHPVTLKPDDRDAAGATEFIKWSWSGFAEERTPL